MQSKVEGVYVDVSAISHHPEVFRLGFCVLKGNTYRKWSTLGVTQDSTWAEREAIKIARRLHKGLEIFCDNPQAAACEGCVFIPRIQNKMAHETAKKGRNEIPRHRIDVMLRQAGTNHIWEIARTSRSVCVAARCKNKKSLSSLGFHVRSGDVSSVFSFSCVCKTVEDALEVGIKYAKEKYPDYEIFCGNLAIANKTGINVSNSYFTKLASAAAQSLKNARSKTLLSSNQGP